MGVIKVKLGQEVEFEVEQIQVFMKIRNTRYL